MQIPYLASDTSIISNSVDHFSPMECSNRLGAGKRDSARMFVGARERRARKRLSFVGLMRSMGSLSNISQCDFEEPMPWHLINGRLINFRSATS